MKLVVEKLIRIIILLFSVGLIVSCTVELIGSMLVYKYHFEDFTDVENITVAFDDRTSTLRAILVHIIVFVVYLWMLISYLFYKLKLTKMSFDMILAIVSLLFFIFCAYHFINYIAEYSHLQSSGNHNLSYSYAALKLESGLIIGYLKAFIPYLAVVAGYFYYKIRQNQKPA